MEPLSESTKLHQISSEKLSLTSPLAILPENQSENSFLREDSERLTDKEFLFHQTPSSPNHSESTVSITLKILSTKSTLSDLTSSKLTTSFGPSNLEDLEEDSLTRDIPSKEEETGETESNISTNSLPKCSDSI